MDPGDADEHIVVCGAWRMPSECELVSSSPYCSPCGNNILEVEIAGRAADASWSYDTQSLRIWSNVLVIAVSNIYILLIFPDLQPSSARSQTPPTCASRRRMPPTLHRPGKPYAPPDRL